MNKRQVYEQIVVESQRRQDLGETCRAHMISKYLDGKISSRELSDTECVVSSEYRNLWNNTNYEIA